MSRLPFKQKCPWTLGVPPAGVKPTRVIVTGTRTFDDPEFLYRKLDKLTYWFDLVELVIGSDGLKTEKGGEWYWVGADYFAKVWAEANWIPRHFVRPDWDKWGKKAGPIRNTEMVKHAGSDAYCLAFRRKKGPSPGTDDAIRKFVKYCSESRLRVFLY